MPPSVIPKLTMTRPASTDVFVIACCVGVVILAVKYYRATRLLKTSNDPFKRLHHRRNSACISIGSEDDAKTLYSLILDHAQNPDRASLIKEFVHKYPFNDLSDYNHVLIDLFFRLEEEEKHTNVTRDPSMIAAIQKIGFRDSVDTPDKWVRAVSWMNPDRWQIRKIALSRCIGLRDILPREASFYSQYAIASLLYLCPNLEFFTYMNGENFVLEKVLRQNNYRQLQVQLLPKLRELHLLPPKDCSSDKKKLYDGYNILQDVKQFYLLPALESVSVNGVGMEEPYAALAIAYPRTTGIKNFYITNSLYPSSILSSLIRMPRVLEEFTCTTGGRAQGQTMSARTYPKTLGKSLLCQKATLRILDLDVDENLVHSSDGIGEENFDDMTEQDRRDAERMLIGWVEEFRWERDESQGGPLMAIDLTDTRTYNNTIGSMHDFDKLTHLSIGIKLLLGVRKLLTAPYTVPFRLVDALPQSLEYLLIRGYERGVEPVWDEQIAELIAKRKDQLPNLRVVHGIQSCIPSGQSLGAESS